MSGKFGSRRLFRSKGAEPAFLKDELTALPSWETTRALLALYRSARSTYSKEGANWPFPPSFMGANRKTYIKSGAFLYIYIYIVYRFASREVVWG